MSICNIIGCGHTAQYWDRKGFSIGVNDCFKFHPTNYLIVVNKLKPERAQIVWNSRPEKLFSHLPLWGRHPSYEWIGPLMQWRARKMPARRNVIYNSNNSPFIACSMAFNLGFKNIVLWGVDFIGHPEIQGDQFNRAKNDFLSFDLEIQKEGAKIYLGISGSLLPFDIFA